jgi:hypothetical protein
MSRKPTSKRTRRNPEQFFACLIWTRQKFCWHWIAACRKSRSQIVLL